MSPKTTSAKWARFLFVFYSGLTLLPIRILIVPPLELLPLWAHLAKVLAGLIFGGLILIVVRRYHATKCPLLGFQQLVPLATGVLWAYFIVALILNMPLRHRLNLSNMLATLVVAILWAFIWANPWRTAAQPSTGDKQ